MVVAIATLLSLKEQHHENPTASAAHPDHPPGECAPLAVARPRPNRYRRRARNLLLRSVGRLSTNATRPADCRSIGGDRPGGEGREWLPAGTCQCRPDGGARPGGAGCEWLPASTCECRPDSRARSGGAGREWLPAGACQCWPGCGARPGSGGREWLLERTTC